MDVPQFTLDDFEQRYRERHLVHSIPAKWAAERPDAPAIMNADRKQQLHWHAFEREATALAMQLVSLGFSKGDFVVTSLPLLTEHILLEFACFKLGVIFVPLDLRLAPADVIRAIELLRPRAFAFPGVTPMADFRELGHAVRRQCPSIPYLVQFSSPGETLEGAQSYFTSAEQARKLAEGNSTARRDVDAAYQRATAAVGENDGALVIFTTGSTGSPKPALLSHRGITCQCMCISGAFFGADRGTRTLVNLPPSHVGCQTELLMGTLFGGGTAIVLETFDAARSLRAIAEHRVETVGQIPAMFNFEWRLKDYGAYDLSSLRFAAYGGQQVSRAFVTEMAKMAPVVATGLGLTEASGFCTYVQASASDAEQVLMLGRDMPIYPISIRRPMRDDGRAGNELPDNEVGHVCFRGPQTFLGYINDPEATAKTISRDGYLYTGDVGFKDANGLHLTGRAKLIIKPFGYQVFPADVENHVCALADEVAACAVVGAEHKTISEAIVAFVEKKPGAELTVQKLERHARALAPYMRPRHWVLLEPGQMPLNRVIKPDYVRLQQLAREEVERLRQRGEWDR